MSARSKTLAPVGAVVAVVVIAGAAALLSHDGGSHRPARLHLSSGAREASGLAAPAATSDARAAGGAYTLVGSLPSGTPDDGRAYTLPRGFADEKVVRALATALDVPAPVKGKDGWTAGGLTVSASSGQAWWWSPCFTPDGSVSNAKDAVCAVAIEGSGSSSSGTGSAPAAGAPDAPVPAGPGAVAPTAPSSVTSPVPPVVTVPPPSPGGVLPTPAPLPEPSVSAVRAAAAPVLDALGIDDSAAHIQTYPGGGSVTVDPKVDGLETVGLATSIGVDGRGAITNANGWLSVPDAGDSYPLISAQKAFDALPTYARMMLCPVGPDGKGCTEPEPQQVTGAHLGLSVASLEQDVLALLPTWLFDVKGQDYPLTGIAVDPSYLDTGTPTATDDPGIVPPGEPSSTDPVAPSRPVAITGWSPSKGDNAVTVHYTTDGCGLTDVGADVKEDATTVYVVLHGTRPGPNVACSEIAQLQTFEVALQAPLGDRKVVDASSGQPVPRA